jgi:voltage-gated potassium channel Kch
MLVRFFHISLLILVTTAIHGIATSGLMRLTDRFGERFRAGRLAAFRTVFVPLLVLAMLLVSLLEACLWGWYYWATGQIAAFMDSVYFSLVTMTTVGYGDITLAGGGRTSSGMQAALGIVLFGWTTAVIFMAVQAVHLSAKGPAPPDPP